jgi:hypothetical protein
VEFVSPDSTAKYKLQWKEHPQPWESAASKELKAFATSAEIEDLQPGTTYCIRLASTDGSLEPGPELILDTEQVGCTPQAKKGCCTIS